MTFESPKKDELLKGDHNEYLVESTNKLGSGGNGYIAPVKYRDSKYAAKVYNCASKPRHSLEEISKMFQNAPPHPQPRNKSEQIFKKAIDNIQNGNFSRSIQLMKMSIEALPPNSKGALGNRYAELSRCYAYAGAFNSANSACWRPKLW